MTSAARWPYALVYFWYFAALGAYTPYIGRWLDSLGHGGYVIGAVMAIWYGSRILAPPLWAVLVRDSARPGGWLLLGCVFSLLAFAGFTQAPGALGLVLLMLAFGLFANAVLPQFEAMTLGALGSRVQDYGRLRLWGSVGFLFTAGGYGALLDRLGDAAFPWLVLPLLLALVLSTLLHQRPASVPAPEAQGEAAGHLWRRPGVRRFLLVAMLTQVGFGPFYVFLTLHLQANGHDGLAVGALWAVGVLVEIALFWAAPGLIARFGARRLLQLSLAATVLRWAVTALFAQSFAIMLIAQSTHALGFAMFHACCMRLMAEYFPGRRQAAGQGLLYGFSSGVGGVLGALLAAGLWEYGGGTWAFFGGAAATALALLLQLGARRGAV